MGREPPPSLAHPELVVAWAAGFGLAADLLLDGPPGVGLPAVAGVAALGLLALTRPRAPAVLFLAVGSLLVSFAVVRASPVLVGLDVSTAVGLFALAGAFAREGEPLRAGLRTYAVRGVAWIASVPDSVVLFLPPVTRLLPSKGRLPRVPRPLLIALPAGLTFALLFASADAVFADLLRTPFEHLPVRELPRHAAIVGTGALAFVTIAVRAMVPVRTSAAEEPIGSGSLRPADWATLLITVDLLFTAFVAVQFVALFGDGDRVVRDAGITYAAYARSGFWQLLAAASLTGAVLAAAWIGGRPSPGRQRAWFTALAVVMVGLSVIVLVSAFRRLVLYEDAFGFTWPRVLGHAATMLTGALLACGLLAMLLRRTGRLPAAALALGVLTIAALNLLDPEAFIAERNIARAVAGHELDTGELASLSADAVPAIVDALPRLGARRRSALERSLACLRQELRQDVERYGWASFNAARDIALERLIPMPLPRC